MSESVAIQSRRNGRETKSRIEAEALRLFAEKGVDATSIRDIAEAVGVAEGTLYRHYRSKDALSRTLFLESYAKLAVQMLEIGISETPFPVRMAGLIRCFTQLFDEDEALFAFILINQHRHLETVPETADTNPVEALTLILLHAMESGEIETQNPDLLAALVLGLVVQPAIFRIYGRIEGKLTDHAGDITKAALALLGDAASH